MNPLDFLKCENRFEVLAMQAVAQRADEDRRRERTLLAAEIAFKVWEGF